MARFNRILTAEDIVGPHTRKWILVQAARRGLFYSGQVKRSQALPAVVDFGRWLARCECGGAEYVTPQDPVFYCLSCGNAQHQGHLRPVKFPSDKQRAQIEKILLARPAPPAAGMGALAGMAPGSPPYRNWEPGTSLAQLRRENAEMRGA